MEEFEDPTKCDDCGETFEFEHLHIVGKLYICGSCHDDRKLLGRYEWERDPMDVAKERKYAL